MFNVSFSILEFGMEEERPAYQVETGSHSTAQERKDPTRSLLPRYQGTELRALPTEKGWIDSSPQHRYKRRHRQHQRHQAQQ